MSADHEAVLAALKAAPKPLTEERAAAIAAEVLTDGTRASQFKDWLRQNFKHLQGIL